MLAVEYRGIDSLIPYANNARTHSDEQVAQIAASIKEFGWTNPVLVDGDNGVIAGHGRILGARKLGIEEIPVIELGGLSDAQKRAYVLADNKLAQNAGWDNDLLGIELGGLDAEGFDLSLIGFSDLELRGLLEPMEGLTDPDDVPEAPDDPVTNPGDVWILGKHRLKCGDSTNADDVAAALNGVEPHLMVTDPPYGVEYDAHWRVDAGLNQETAAHGKVENDNKADWRGAWMLFPGDVAYVWHAGQHANVVVDSLAACGLNIRSQIIWVKNNIVMSRGDYHYKHEPCWYAVRKGKVGHYVGGRKQSTVWDIDKPRKSETGHSTQKPVECMKRPIENNSSPGQAVYDPFLGSGTTIIAAEMTGRACHGLELSPAYCDVIVKRWQDFTGEQATTEGSGSIMQSIKADAA